MGCRITNPEEIAKIEAICREAGWSTGEVARMPGERAARPANHPTPLGVRGWTIRIPNWHPTLLNKLLGSHWAQAARMKKADMTIISHAARGIPAADGKRRLLLHIVLEPNQRAGDPDAYWKSLLDGLVHCGALRNDSREWVECEPPTFSRGAEKVTFVTLEENP
jgi:hypothetical protein